MLAIIGGTGLYNIQQLKVIASHKVGTPFGAPSAEIVRAQYQDKEIYFLPRHGEQHQLLPSEVNYRANIWALKSLGVTQIIGVSAVGSLREDIHPGDLSIPSQYFDFIKGHREKSFFGNGMVAHVSTAEPTCFSLSEKIIAAAKNIGIDILSHKTYACVDGPRLGTRAESLFLRNAAGCDLVGMTNVPEAFLAREAQISYCTIAIATDYDCWREESEHHVSVEQVIKRYGASIEKAQSVLLAYLSGEPAECSGNCRHSLATALLTPEAHLSQQQAELLAVLKR